MLKNGAPWVYRGTSELRLLGFIPWPQVPEHTQGLPEGTYPKLVCMMLSHAHSSQGLQAPVRGAGFWGSHRTVYWPLVLDPVRFYPGLGVGGVFSLQLASGEFVG